MYIFAEGIKRLDLITKVWYNIPRLSACPYQGDLTYLGDNFVTEASQQAIDFATEQGVDVNDVLGTGKDGSVLISDVRMYLADHKNDSNILGKLQEDRAKSTPGSSVEPLVGKAIKLLSAEELGEIIASMRTEIESLRESQAGLIERESHSRDLTEDLLFISKPNGHRWEERRIVDGRTMVLEFVATQFIGPFKDQEQVDTYIKAKRSRRADSYIDWANVKVLDGREARRIDAEEKADREGNFASSAPVNALDRRIFAQAHTGHVPGTGSVLGRA